VASATTSKKDDGTGDVTGNNYPDKNSYTFKKFNSSKALSVK
jgi:hypothetical protein